MSSSASSQVHPLPLARPRSPAWRSGCRIRSGSSTWLIVAGPLAQLRPREPGVGRVALELVIVRSSLATCASRPHADSQLKQVVGISMNSRATLRGCAFASYAVKESHSSGGGKFRRPSWAALAGQLSGDSGTS